MMKGLMKRKVKQMSVLRAQRHIQGFIHSYSRRFMEVSRQSHASSALTPNKKPSAHVEYESEWATETEWIFRRRNKIGPGQYKP